MNWTQSANLGLRFAGQQNDRIGFTAPTTIYEKMRQIQAFAQSLDLNISQYVADPIFKSSWNSWYENAWKPFYDKYAGPNATTGAKTAALFYTDQLNEQTESYRKQLENFEKDYSIQRQASGQRVPELPGSSPSVREPLAVPGAPLPWWVWFGGGILFVGLGYVVFKKVSSHERKTHVKRDPDTSFVFEPGSKAVMTLADYARLAK